MLNRFWSFLAGFGSIGGIILLMIFIGIPPGENKGDILMLVMAIGFFLAAILGFIRLR